MKKNDSMDEENKNKSLWFWVVCGFEIWKQAGRNYLCWRELRFWVGCSSKVRANGA
jgi:hypothetical protein